MSKICHSWLWRLDKVSWEQLLLWKFCYLKCSTGFDLLPKFRIVYLINYLKPRKSFLLSQKIFFGPWILQSRANIGSIIRFIRVKLSGLISKKRSRPDLWQMRRYSIINLRERSACLITARKMFSKYISIYSILPGVILSTSILCRYIYFFSLALLGRKRGKSWRVQKSHGRMAENDRRRSPDTLAPPWTRPCTTYTQLSPLSYDNRCDNGLAYLMHES